MAAEVSSLLRIMNAAAGGVLNDSSSSSSSSANKSTALITRDLLGGCRSLDSKELDLDLQVPSGWEKRLDLKVLTLIPKITKPTLCFFWSFFISDSLIQSVVCLFVLLAASFVIS